MRRAKKRKAPCNIPMTLAGILFCLTLISIHFTGGLYARYTTSAAASDSARVVTFGQVTLTETVDGNTIDASYQHLVTPGVDINKDVNVAFTACEVDTYIFDLNCHKRRNLTRKKMQVLNSYPIFHNLLSLCMCIYL